MGRGCPIGAVGLIQEANELPKKSYSQIGAEIAQAIEKLRGIELQGAVELRRYWKEHANQLGLPPFRAIGPIPDAVRKAYANKQ